MSKARPGILSTGMRDGAFRDDIRYTGEVVPDYERGANVEYGTDWKCRKCERTGTVTYRRTEASTDNVRDKIERGHHAATQGLCCYPELVALPTGPDGRHFYATGR